MTLPAGDHPERWSLDAGDTAVARLDVPAHATREREFEIDVRLVVRAGAGADPEHGLRVLVDGQQQWQRRVRTAPDGYDSLEWRQRRRVPVGQALRVQALSEVRHALRLRVLIDVVEQ